MKCDVYKSDAMKGVYVFIKDGSPLEPFLLDDSLKGFNNPYRFKTIEFDDDSPLIAADPKIIKKSIEAKGFHIQKTDIKSSNVSGAGAAIGGGLLAASLGFGIVGAAVAAIGSAILANAANSDKDKSGGDSDES
ncbi:hypothetical protein GNP80_15150 [Aliivibrio fischeri]|uniref:YcgL domain-containing protein n=1 Tax=Aliivibrio fischeri TaxID=668 RepID=UPI0012DA1A43|nr:YcgL domain-containing protein [Aliivibrio fischeri]MUK93767.1 hypothetical protein [Aliivibrio fischeri]